MMASAAARSTIRAAASRGVRLSSPHPICARARTRIITRLVHPAVAPRAPAPRGPWRVCGRRALSSSSSDGGSSSSSSGGGGGGNGDSTKKPPPPPPIDAYVHPLSQIVLEHLQTSRSDFLLRSGLDSGLTLRPDGTFVLRFPPRPNPSRTAFCTDGNPEEEEDRIWTSYDPREKRHWLAVQRGELVGRFLLQDNLQPAWHSGRRSTHDKVRDAVDEMIRKLEAKEGGGGGK